MVQGEIAAGGRSQEFIAVSSRMTVLLAAAAVGAPVPPGAAALTITLAGGVCSLHVEPEAGMGKIRPGQIVLLVSRSTVTRLGGAALLDEGFTRFHLSSELRTIATLLRDPPASPKARSTYQGAKAMEFLCEALRQFAAGELAPLLGEGLLSQADTRRVLAAREMIDERWSEKLTLDLIARACGLNRTKLTRGFKDLFNCTVAEAIAERRLDLARRMLLTTDLPVSSIGYESGYLNNASFARAFGRRFGRSPSDFRVQGLAA